MSVFDNMAYGLKIAKVPKDEIETRVQKAAKILELGKLLERKTKSIIWRTKTKSCDGKSNCKKSCSFFI